MHHEETKNDLGQVKLEVDVAERQGKTFFLLMAGQKFQALYLGRESPMTPHPTACHSPLPSHHFSYAPLWS